jgi:hypothetical protein
MAHAAPQAVQHAVAPTAFLAQTAEAPGVQRFQQRLDVIRVLATTRACGVKRSSVMSIVNSQLWSTNPKAIGRQTCRCAPTTPPRQVGGARDRDGAGEKLHRNQNTRNSEAGSSTI